MQIVFMGTPEQAAQILEELILAGHQILCVVTQPDRPRGRGQKIEFSPVKEVALKHTLPIEQPEKVKGNEVFVSLIKSLQPDILVVVAYGQILPKKMLEIPKYGAVNVHASLLPRYRGAAPIQWALLSGEKETGITLMKIDELLDTGDIIFQEKVMIEAEDNAVTLSKKLFLEGSKLLIRALAEIEKGSAKYQKQNEKEATYAPSLTKESGEIDWKKPAAEIHNRVRALVPWPGAHTYFKGKLLKIWRSEVSIADLITGKKAAGEIVQIVKNLGFIVSTGSGDLLVLEVQPEGRQKMGAYDFCIGHGVQAGEVFPS